MKGLPLWDPNGSTLQPVSMAERSRVPMRMGGYIGVVASRIQWERRVRFKSFQACRITIAVVLAIGCEKAEVPKPAVKAEPQYPPHWWAPVSKEGAPDWEIFPQEAKSGEVILSKRNELGILSNFAVTPFEFHGRRYESLEGFWQMMKFPEGPDDPRSKFPGMEWKLTRDAVSQMTGFDAKRAGDVGSRNMAKMGIDWVTFEGKQMPYKPKEPGEHYRLIEEATRAKVRQNPDVKRILLSTGDLILKPDHHQEADAAAAWRYYDILMKIRDELRHEASGSQPPTK